MTEIYLALLLLGACVGSFLNVVIYRLPKNQSIIFKRSNCPSCKRKLNIVDLFPIISWIFLRGNCRYCNNSISIRYPFVEFFTSILFLLCLESNGFDDSYITDFYVVISGLILVFFLIALSLIDIDEMILPNSLTYSGSVIGLVLSFFYYSIIKDYSLNFFKDNLFACLGAFFAITIFSYIVEIIIKKPGIGGGDAKLFAMSGAWLGTDGLQVTITLSFLLSAIYVAFGLMFRSLKRGEYIPLGPFICCSIFIVWQLGSSFWFESLGDIFWWKYL